MISDIELVEWVKLLLERFGWKVTYYGIEHYPDLLRERDKMREEGKGESLEYYRLTLRPDLKAEKDGITIFVDAKEPINKYKLFLPETLAIIFAKQREEETGEQTFYCVKIDGEVRLMNVLDETILHKTKKLWHRPQYHTLDSPAWKLINEYSKLFGWLLPQIHCTEDEKGRYYIHTHIDYVRNSGKISADLCNEIPQSALLDLPTLEQHLEQTK